MPFFGDWNFKLNAGCETDRGKIIKINKIWYFVQIVQSKGKRIQDFNAKLALAFLVERGLAQGLARLPEWFRREGSFEHLGAASRSTRSHFLGVDGRDRFVGQRRAGIIDQFAPSFTGKTKVEGVGVERWSR